MKLKTITQYLLILSLLFCANTIFGQNQLAFTYDEGGNQIERKLVCINCAQANVTHTEILDKEKQDSLLYAQLQDLQKKDMLALTGRQLNAYPNPLTEVLNVKWSSTDQSYIATIDVFALNGVCIYHKNYAYNQTETDISFLNLSAGMYVLRGIYNDGKQENVKVLKH